MTEDHYEFLKDLVSEMQIALGPDHLRCDVFHNGSQPDIDYFESVDPNQAAVRVTHFPSGTVEMCNVHKTRIENKITALVRVLLKLHAGT